MTRDGRSGSLVGMDPDMTLAALPILALIDSTSVGTLVIPLMLLVTGRDGARRVAGRTVVYLLIIGAFYLMLGTALLAGLLPLYRALQGLLDSPATLVVLALVGAGLVVWSYYADPKAVRRRGGDPEASGRRWMERVHRALGSWRLLVGLALIAGVIEAASMIPYLAAMGVIAHAGLSFPMGVLVLIGYCAVMILPGLVLAGARALAGARVDRVLDRLQAWGTRNAASAVAWGIGIIGVVLLINTVPQVLSTLA